jgi:simple sugar transport system ATP-binding protein
MNSGDSSVSMRGISKSFYGLKAVRGAELSVRAGDIHGLLGQNGAGKTTLMNILAGIYRAEAGEIKINGRPVSCRSPREARRAGIGMVHQHFRLIPSFSVAENIALAKSGLFLSPAKLRKHASRLVEQYGFSIPPNARVAELSVGQAQKVEIAKALFTGARVLILDEPTAVLTPGETEELFSLFQNMCAAGLTIIFITHKLGEVLAFTDRITVMRRGRTVQTLRTPQADAGGLASLMFGRVWDAWQTDAPRQEQGAPGSRVLCLDQVSLPDQGTARGLHEVSLEVRAGGITGIAGISGNGQQALAELLIGLRKPAFGRMVLNGEAITSPSAAGFIRRGVAYVPGDRLGEGLCPGLGAGDNTALKQHDQKPFAHGGLLDPAEARQAAGRIVQQYGIKIQSLDSPVSLLSGGNLQRLIIGRELLSKVRLLVAVNPSRGLDIEGIALMQQKLIELRGRGVAIVLISEDLEELQAVSDHLHVIYDGRLSPAIPRGEQDAQRIGRLMGGVGFGGQGLAL